MDTSVLKKVDRRIIKTKTSIFTALFELLKDHDYEKITVEDIVSYANIARKTFYLHFSCKDDIILQIKDMMYEYFKNAIDEASKNKEHTVHDLFMVIKEVIKQYYPQLKFIFTKETNTIYFSKFLSDLFSYYLDLILIKEYKLDENKKEYYYSFYGEGFTKSFITWIKKEDISLDEYIFILESICFKGGDFILASKKI